MNRSYSLLTRKREKVNNNKNRREVMKIIRIGIYLIIEPRGRVREYIEIDAVRVLTHSYVL